MPNTPRWPRWLARVSACCATRPVAALNLALLPACLLAGFAAYHGRVSGWGDDWNAFGPAVWPTSWDILKDWYLKANGRLTNNLVVALIRLVLPHSRFSPDAYPWWLLLTVSYFCMFAAPMNIAAAAWRLVGGPWRVFAAVVTAVWLLATLTWTTYSATTLAIDIVYTLAIFALSVGLLACTARGGRGVLWWLASVLVYLAVSLSSEQLMTSAPVLFAAFSVLACHADLQPRRQWRRELPVWLLTSAAAVLIYLASPGQQARNVVLRAEAPGLSRLIAASRTYLDGVASIVRILVPDLPFAWCLASTIGVLLVSCAALLAARPSRNPSDRTRLLGALVVCLLCGFFASLVHLLGSSYFPEERARMYPAMLLALAWSCAVALLLSWLRRRALRVVCAVSAAGVVLALAPPKIEQVVNSYRRAVWLSDIRTRNNRAILALYPGFAARMRPGTPLVLVGCPPDLEPFWGFSGYFTWAGHPEVWVLTERGTYMRRALRKRTTLRMPCAYGPPLTYWSWRGGTPAPVPEPALP